MSLAALYGTSWSGVPTADQILSSSARYLDFQNTDPYAYTYTNGSPSPFKRVIVIASAPGSNGDKVIVRSIVAWRTRGGVSMSVDVEDYFFNWRQ